MTPLPAKDQHGFDKIVIVRDMVAAQQMPPDMQRITLHSEDIARIKTPVGTSLRL